MFQYSTKERIIMGKVEKIILFRIILTGILLLTVIFTDIFKSIEIIVHLIIFLIIAYDIIWKAVLNIKKGQFLDENFLMSFAAIAAFILGQYDEAIEVMLFYQVGELFQDIAVNKSRKSISSMMNMVPEFANIEKDGQIIQCDPDDVEIDDILVIRPGEKIPVDGVIVEGFSSINTSAITGENKPKDVEVGDEVISGCINNNKLIKIRAVKKFEDSTVSKILELVENAADKKAKSEKFVTKFARYYTPTVVGLAALLALIPPILTDLNFTMWINRALVFLVSSCPCALVISIPLGFFGGIGGASRNGILIKGGNYLETLSKVGYVVFDKTGTLTKGNFKVVDLIINEYSKEELLEYTSLSEAFSTHPIAVSIKEEYGKELDTSRVKDIQEIAGIGISAVVDDKKVYVGNEKMLAKFNIKNEIITTGTVINTVIDSSYAGSVVISDEVKNESKQAVELLKNNYNVKTIMLTGDNFAVAKEVGDELGIDEVRAQLLPDEKAEIVQEIIKSKDVNKKVAFVGDGINDAPVLSIADVGIAMGAMGSDAAIEAADIVLMDDNPKKVVSAIKVAKKTMNVVMQNIIFAIGVKILVMVLGAFGIANIQAGIFADMGVSVIAILNASRTLMVKE
ncbi:cadmium-exporting ATPase [[Eubacterium] yurii subsp. margaretiae ATCC 43715]|nr:cadmium-exporting ATPase [[Eubacterium] yurii subsp. margaretiae ATCC 43715]